MASYQPIQPRSQEEGRFSEYLKGHSCSRCGGMFIRESLLDLFDDTGQIWRWGLRCVQCGNVVDPVILKHRTNADLPNPKNNRRRRWSSIQSINGSS